MPLVVAVIHRFWRLARSVEHLSIFVTAVLHCGRVGFFFCPSLRAKSSRFDFPFLSQQLFHSVVWVAPPIIQENAAAVPSYALTAGIPEWSCGGEWSNQCITRDYTGDLSCAFIFQQTVESCKVQRLCSRTKDMVYVGWVLWRNQPLNLQCLNTNGPVQLLCGFPFVFLIFCFSPYCCFLLIPYFFLPGLHFRQPAVDQHIQSTQGDAFF